MPVGVLTALALLLVPRGAAEVFKTPVWSDRPAASFEVVLDGSPATVRSVQSADKHLILLLVLDTVSRPDRAAAARTAVIEKLSDLGPKYYAGILTAQDGLEVQQAPIRSRNRLRQKLESLDVRGVPGLLDVVVQTSRIADETLGAADVRLAVLFLTDGEIEDYRGDYTIPVVNPSDRSDLSRRFRSQLILERVRSITDSLASAQAPLFFLHLARQYDDLNEVYQSGISEFARVTGGRALFAAGVQEIAAMAEQLLDEIAAHSVLTIEADCEGLHRLEVRADGASARHKEVVRCGQSGS